MTITAGVASIKGTYQGDVALTDQEQPGAFTLGPPAPARRARSAPTSR